MSDTPSSPAPRADEGFDPLEFWIRYKSTIRNTGAVVVAALVGYGLMEWTTYQKNQAAAEAFALAKTPEELAAFAKEHRGMPSAGNATLLLASKQRAGGQLDDSLKTLKDFLVQYPNHPLAHTAHMGIAAALELQGKQEEALSAYRMLVSIEPRGVSAPAALLRIARILKSQNKPEEAKAGYESLQNQFPTSSFANEALQEAQQLAPPAQPVTATPAPVTAPAPTPVPAETPAPTKPLEAK
jgi:TolA-binding protein